METKHTKGEWLQLVDDDENLSTMVISVTGGCRNPIIADTSFGKSNLTDEERIYNAKLIAAAPELLEACIKAEKHHQGLHSEIGSILREAIKKATE